MADPFWFRAVIGGVFLSLFLLSFLVAKIRDNFTVIFAWTAFLPTLWWAYMLYINHLNPGLKSTTFIIVFGVSLVLPSRRMMGLYTFTSLLAIGAAGFLTSNPLSDPEMNFFLLVVILMVANLSLGYRIYYKNLLERSHTRIRTIQDGVFKSGSDGFLVSGDDGKIIDLNNRAILLWQQEGTPRSWRGQSLDSFFIWEEVTEPEHPRKVAEKHTKDLKSSFDEEINFNNLTSFRMRSQPLEEGSDSVVRLWNFIDITSQKEKERSLLYVEGLLRAQNELLIQFLGEEVVNQEVLQHLFEEITRSTVKTLKVDTASIWLIDDEYENLNCVCIFGAENQSIVAGHSINIPKNQSYFSALSDIRIIAVENIEQALIPAVFFEGNKTGKPQSIIHIPIWQSGRVMGVFSLESYSKTRKWTLLEKQYSTSHADLIAMARDRFLKQEAEELLDRTVNVMNTLFEASEMAILVASPERKIVEWNEKYLEIWNIDEEFLRDAPFSELMVFCENQLKNPEEYRLQTVMLSDNPEKDYQYILEFQDGRYVERFSKSITVRGSNVARAIFYLDITDKKHREHELVTRNFELDSFVYRASHDLKAPLNSIMGLISIIKNEDNLEGVLTYIRLMDRSVSKLDAFIRQLTEFSQNTRVEIENVPVIFDEMLNTAVENLRYMDEANRVTLHRNISQEGDFQSDPMRLGIVFNNLVSNSVKYQDHEKDHPQINVEIVAGPKEALITLSDNGIGIPEEHLNKVFDLFFRASIQSTGTGLGLYITRSAIEYLGGTVEITSKVGEGTIFKIRLPNGGEKIKMTTTKT